MVNFMCCIFYHRKKKSSHFIRHLDMFVMCSFLCASNSRDLPNSCGLDLARIGKGLLPNCQPKVSLPERQTRDNRHRVWHMPEF